MKHTITFDSIETIEVSDETFRKVVEIVSPSLEEEIDDEFVFDIEDTSSISDKIRDEENKEKDN